MSKVKISDSSDPSNLQRAVEVLREGGLVAFPTETVYGLGADAANPQAVCRIFEAKKRPSFDPLIVHVSGMDEARSLWKEVPPVALELARRFWPGPLTLVLPKTERVSDVVTAGLPTVAVRMPRCSVAQALIRGLGRPIAAPSANLFGYTTATTARAVQEDLGEKVDVILEGHERMVGVESTVLRIEGGRCFLLRPGGVPVEDIEKIAPVLKAAPGPVPACPPGRESPGQLKVHYAPWTAFALADKPFPELLKELKSLRELCVQKKAAWPRMGLLAFPPNGAADPPLAGGDRYGEDLFEAVENLSPAGDLREAASNLFQAVRKLDRMHLDLIVAEAVPESGLGLAIMDRFRKASAGEAGVMRFFSQWLK